VRERSHDLGFGFVRITIGTKTELNKLLQLFGPGR
jgi:histidinol-phosphate/aromatic aminotransferase/cobyric acid decarboxylase-like protein